MPQSTKDSAGGKTHATPKSKGGGSAGEQDKKKKSSENSPTGPHKHGEKKTTP